MAKHDTVLNTKTVEYEISSAAYESDATEICLFPNNTDNTTMKYDFEYQGTDVYFKVNIYNSADVLQISDEYNVGTSGSYTSATQQSVDISALSTDIYTIKIYVKGTSVKIRYINIHVY